MKVSVLNFKKLADNPDFRLDADYAVHPYTQGGAKFHAKFLPLNDLVSYISSGHTPYHHDMVTGDVDFVTIDCLSDLTLDTTNFKHITKAQFDSEFKSNRVVANSILCTIKRRICRAYPFLAEPEAPIAMNQDVAFIIPKETTDAAYLASYLGCKIGQNYAWQNKTEQMNPYISVASLGRLPIAIVSKEFQGIIRNLFLKLDAFNRESCEQHVKAEQSLLKELNLASWQPRHKKSFVKKYSDTQAMQRVDAEYFQPKYEEIVNAIKRSKVYARLGDIVSIKKCFEPGSAAYQETGIPFVRVSNLSKFGINPGNQQYISELLYKELVDNQPKTGEILLSKDASPGIAYHLNKDPGRIIPSSGILRLNVKSGIDVSPEYLTLVLNSTIVQKQIERDAGGSIINHWLVDQVKKTLIPILPITQQKELVKQLQGSFANRDMAARLLELSKRGIEIAIEKSEKDAKEYLAAESKKAKIKI